MQAEQDTLSEYVERTGMGTSAEDFQIKGSQLGYTLLGGGNEHDVLLDTASDRVLKITNTPCSYGARSRLVDYLENLLMANILLGDDFRLEGILSSDGAMPYLIISQPFIKGSKADEASIRNYWEKLGFHPCGCHSYLHACGTLVADARPDNVYRTQTGDIIPLDVQILHGERYLQYMLLNLLACTPSARQLTEEAR